MRDAECLGCDSAVFPASSSLGKLCLQEVFFLYFEVPSPDELMLYDGQPLLC